ncbi:MAG: TraB/GumN family protein [Bacteroidetes bacterium]|nr:MAG: TraB/GumN family protein [Bacteroidota bacterium]
MYRIIVTSFLGLLLFFPALLLAQNGQADTAKTLLYRVSGNGLKTPSYLYGTIHAICQDDLQLHDSIFSVLPQCKSLVLETNSDDLEPMEMIRLSFMKGDTSLKMLLSEAKLKEIETFFKKELNMPMNGEARFKPILIGTMAMTVLVDCPMSQIASVENVLSIEAKKYKLKTQYLESPEFQLNVLDSIPYMEQAEQLYHMIDHIDDSKKAFAELTLAYQNMDLQLIDSLMLNDIQGLAKEPSILQNRNYAWVAKLKGMMAKEACFFAVGAGHLAGEESIIQLLRKEGYAVEPVLKP